MTICFGTRGEAGRLTGQPVGPQMDTETVTTVCKSRGLKKV